MIRKIVIVIFLLLIVMCPIVNSIETEAELEITDIYIINNFLKADSLHFSVKNIDDSPTYGVTYRVVIERLLFATIAIRKITDYTTSYGSDDPLSPGETWNFEIRGPNKIFTGFYMVHVYLNPDEVIIGNGFNNNYRCEKFLAIGFVFLNWFQCY